MVKGFGRRRKEDRVETELIIGYLKNSRKLCPDMPEYVYAFSCYTLPGKLSKVEERISPRELVNVVVIALSEIGDADLRQRVPDVLRVITPEIFPSFGEQAANIYAEREKAWREQSQ